MTESRPLSREIEITADQTTDVKLELERWAELPKTGWHSGENHIHANDGYDQWYNSPATMLTQCAGEGLGVCNFVVANIDGLRAGRTFVTNTPMREFSVGPHQLGDTIKLDKPREFTIVAKAQSHFPISKVEVLYNGQVIASVPLPDNKQPQHSRRR